jgi:hypothetical protein
MAKLRAKQLVVCVGNDGHPASLEKRKIYVVLPDAVAHERGLIRIVDESGDACLYSQSLFRPIALPLSIRRAVLAAARFDYRLENDPRFLRRIEKARKSLRAGRGVRLEDI